MAKDINKKEFDEATLLKLEIFRECFREWLPVFIHSPLIIEGKFNKKILNIHRLKGDDIYQIKLK